MASESGGSRESFSDHDACKLLTGLVLEHLPSFEKLRRARSYAKGKNVWTPGQPADSVFFLVRGQIAILVKDRERHETIVHVVDSGEPFGELCYCARNHRKRHNFSRAISSSQVIELPLSEFLLILKRDQGLMERFIFTFCERFTEAQRRVKVLANRSAEARLGTLLLQLARSRGKSSGKDGSHVVLHTTHAELASWAAMSRSHVTVTMGRFRRKELVHYTRDKPIIVDVHALERYLDAHYPPD
jgi:CRP-like cAMP-binding protein